MPTSELRKLLNEEAAFQEFSFIIPHPFLPPRYQKLSRERNMVLFLDQNLTVHVRWEGARMHEHLSLTSKATSRLIKEVLRNMTVYRREINVFSRFIEDFAEQPFENPRYDASTTRKETPAAAKGAKDKAIEVTASIHIPFVSEPTLTQLEMELSFREQTGGESPMGDIDGY